MYLTLIGIHDIKLKVIGADKLINLLHTFPGHYKDSSPSILKILLKNINTTIYKQIYYIGKSFNGEEIFVSLNLIYGKLGSVTTSKDEIYLKLKYDDEINKPKFTIKYIPS